MGKKLCKNCNHEIVREKDLWKHKKEDIEIMPKGYSAICGVTLYGIKFEDFKKRWAKKYNENYIGKHPICGCNKPELK